VKENQQILLDLTKTKGAITMEEEQDNVAVQETSSIQWELKEQKLRWSCDGTLPTVEEFLQALTEQLNMTLTVEGLDELDKQLTSNEGTESAQGELNFGFEDLSVEVPEVAELNEDTHAEGEINVEVVSEIMEDGSLYFEDHGDETDYKKVIAEIEKDLNVKFTAVGAHAIQNEYEIKKLQNDYYPMGFVAAKFFRSSEELTID